MTTARYEEIATSARVRLKAVGQAFFRDEERAEDIAQEVLMRLWMMRDRLDDGDVTEALLVRMAKNLCVSQWRRRSLTTEPMGPELLLMTDEQPLEEDEGLRALQEAIRRLSPHEQRLFRMRHELDMDLSQIVAATGIPPRSVSAIVSGARRKIVEQLKKGGLL